MELASNFADKAASVTCVGRSSIPFANVLGEKIGAMLKKVMGCITDSYPVDFNEEAEGASPSQPRVCVDVENRGRLRDV